MKKLMLSIFSLMLVAAVLVTPVFAGGNNANLPDEETTSVIQPRYTECPECGGTMHHYSTNEGDWEIVDYAPCQYGYGDHTDVVYEKVTVVKYKCSKVSCGIIDTEVYIEEDQRCR